MPDRWPRSWSPTTRTTTPIFQSQQQTTVLTPQMPGPFMFHDHHIFPMPAQEKNELSSHPGQLQRTHCVQCVEGGVIPRGCNAAIFRGASVTHPCKGRHAPGKTGRENGSTDTSTLSFQSTSSAHTKFHYYMHESSALLLLLFKKKKLEVPLQFTQMYSPENI